MLEVNGEPVLMQDFYSHINPPKGVKRVLFKRSGFEPFKKIVSSLDRGPNIAPTPQWQASTTNGDSGGIVIPLRFHAAVDLDPGAQNATMNDVHYFESKQVQQMGNTAVEVFTGDDYYMRGAGWSLDVTTPNGLQIYRMMMISPYNKKNAVRYGKRQSMFEVEDIEVNNREQNKKTVLRNKAIGLAFNEDEVPNALAVQIHREIASYINSSSQSTDELVIAENYETIRGNLSLYASAYPDKFEKLVNDANVGTRGMIKEAVEKGVLKQNKSQWLWGDIQAVKNNKEICVIPVGQDAVQELLNHFVTKKGRKDLALLEEEMEPAGV